MPSTAAMTNYLENELCDHILRNASWSSPATVYVALYTTDPGEDDSGAEATGGDYAREAVTFGAPANGVCANSAMVTFTTATASWGTITHFQIMDAVSGGNPLFHGQLENAVVVGISDTVRFQIGDLEITLS